MTQEALTQSNTGDCSICNRTTVWACSDCQITLAETVHVCTQAACRDAHEKRCVGQLQNKIDSLSASLTQAREDGDRYKRERDGERDARERLDTALRQKDQAMGELFTRLSKAGVDCSDLIP